MDPVIRRFFDVYDDIRENLAQGNIESAQRSYTELYELYERMNAGDHDVSQKELAFDRITAIRQELVGTTRVNGKRSTVDGRRQSVVGSQKSEVGSRKSVVGSSRLLVGGERSKIALKSTLFVIGVLILLGAFITFTQPATTGFAIFGESDPGRIDKVITGTAKEIVILDKPASSVRLKGTLSSGHATVRLLYGDGYLTVFDSNLAILNNDGSFTNACLDTCTLDSQSTVLGLVIEVEGGELYLERVLYD